jgi:hypothetical protein
MMLASRLEVVRDVDGRIAYRLGGCALRLGDALEVWTTIGWVQGLFTWEGEPHFPYISLVKDSGQLEPFVILTSSLCRRPLEGSDRLRG